MAPDKDNGTPRDLLRGGVRYAAYHDQAPLAIARMYYIRQAMMNNG